MGTYLHGHHASVLASHGKRTAANSAAYLVGHLRPGMRLLDVGAGPATITADLARLVHPGPVTATETTPDVVAMTRAALDSLGAGAVETTVADIHDLPFGDATFDVTHAHQVLQHVADPVTALRELARVTRPGGLVAVRDADYAAMAWYPESPALDRWREVYRSLAVAAGGEPDAGRRLLTWARAAGLTDLEAGAETWCYATAEDRAWWSGTWAERATRSTFATQARAAGMSDADLADLAEGWLAWGADPDGWFLIPHGYVLARIP